MQIFRKTVSLGLALLMTIGVGNSFAGSWIENYNTMVDKVGKNAELTKLYSKATVSDKDYFKFLGSPKLGFNGGNVTYAEGVMMTAKMQALSKGSSKNYTTVPSALAFLKSNNVKVPEIYKDKKLNLNSTIKRGEFAYMYASLKPLMEEPVFTYADDSAVKDNRSDKYFDKMSKMYRAGVAIPINGKLNSLGVMSRDEMHAWTKRMINHEKRANMAEYKIACGIRDEEIAQDQAIADNGGFKPRAPFDITKIKDIDSLVKSEYFQVFKSSQSAFSPALFFEGRAVSFNSKPVSVKSQDGINKDGTECFYPYDEVMKSIADNGATGDPFKEYNYTYAGYNVTVSLDSKGTPFSNYYQPFIANGDKINLVGKYGGRADMINASELSKYNPTDTPVFLPDAVVDGKLYISRNNIIKGATSLNRTFEDSTSKYNTISSPFGLVITSKITDTSTMSDKFKFVVADKANINAVYNSLGAMLDSVPMSVKQKYINSGAISGMDTDSYMEVSHDNTFEQDKQFFRDLAKSLTTGASTDEEKVQIITNHLAETMYYDYDLYNGAVQDTWLNTNHSAEYYAYTEKRAVCKQFTEITAFMLNSVGVEAYGAYVVDAGAPHSRNFVKVDGSWRYVDVTWMCTKGTENGVKNEGRGVNTGFYDMTSKVESNLTRGLLPAVTFIF